MRIFSVLLTIISTLLLSFKSSVQGQDCSLAFQNKFYLEEFNSIRIIVRLSNGNYILSGQTQGTSDSIAINIVDKQGRTTSSRVLSTDEYGVYVSSISEQDDKVFISLETKDGGLRVITMDLECQILNESNVIRSPNYTSISTVKIIATDNRRYLLTQGNHSVNGGTGGGQQFQDVYMICLNSENKILWQYTYGDGTSDERPLNFIVKNNLITIIANETNNAILLSLTSEGTFLGQRKISRSISSDVLDDDLWILVRELGSWKLRSFDTSLTNNDSIILNYASIGTSPINTFNVRFLDSNYFFLRSFDDLNWPKFKMGISLFNFCGNKISTSYRNVDVNSLIFSEEGPVDHVVRESQSFILDSLEFVLIGTEEEWFDDTKKQKLSKPYLQKVIGCSINAGEGQIGVPCDDGDPNTINDQIQQDCECRGEAISCRQRDSLALIALYNATAGESWMTPWILSSPLSEWSGVVVNEGGCVISLILLENNLNGQIPAELGNLSELSYLRLGSNEKLTGQIPPELGQLINLRSLYLDNNNLSGSIPTELSQLSNLIYLSLPRNQLSGTIPIELGQLSQLRELDLYDNQLTGSIPPELGQLNQLTFLAIGQNQLTGSIPPELGLLSQMEYLALDNCQLSGPIPAKLGDLTKIGHLYLQNNNLSGCFPSELLIHCDTIYDFSNNPGLPWNGDLTRFCAGEDPNKAYCDDLNSQTQNDSIHDCECRGDVVSCREMDSLALVALYKSTDGPNWTNKWNIGQTMSTWSGVYFNENGCVEILSLENNNLRGPLPIEIGYLNELKQLYLSNNVIIDSIPNTISNLSNLEILSLWNNEISGNIPSTLGNLATLKILYLFLNKLTGEIPASLGNLSNLELLALWNNQLSGPIPGSIGNLSNLVELSLSDNQLTGTIPPSLGSLKRLKDLRLNHNQLTGRIPSELTNLDTCYSLLLNDNSLQGCIPLLPNFCTIEERLSTFFGNELRFNDVNFYNNPGLPWNGDFARHCSGEDQIGTACDDGDPNTINDQIRQDCECRGEMVSCRQRDSLALTVFYNLTDGPNWTKKWDLDSAMSTWWGVSLNETGCVSIIDLDDNGLKGNIPSEIGELDQLEYLALHFNHLTGTIPIQIGTLSQLKYLTLHGNQLSGEIPKELGVLTNLQELNLTFNELSGNIPMELGNLKNLIGLGLHSNHLTGSIPIQIGNLSKLENLVLQGNQLSGQIPSELGNLLKLKHLALYSNQLTGNIPPSFGNLKKCESIYLNNNQLSGPIPPELNLLDSTYYFNASNNQLSGCFPPLQNFCNLDERLDTFGQSWLFNIFDFSNNPDLPWQGDFSRYCAGEDQTRAFCDDLNPETEYDSIGTDCECRGSENPCGGLLVPQDVLIDTDCNTSSGNEITVLFPAAISKVAWWGNNSGQGSTVSFDVFENGTRAYNLDKTTYWLYVENENGCADTLPPFELSESNGNHSIQLKDDMFESDRSEIEINVLTNDKISIADFGLTLLDANYPNKIRHLGDGIFQVAIPPAVNPVITASYTICDRNCLTICDTAKIEVTFRDIPCTDPGNYRLPNVITPFDGNGENDEFKIVAEDNCAISIEQMNIVNRWGDVVWSTNRSQDYWTGLNDQGQPLPEGTYYYHIKIQLPGNGIPVIKTGYVTLLR